MVTPSLYIPMELPKREMKKVNSMAMIEWLIYTIKENILA